MSKLYKIFIIVCCLNCIPSLATAESLSLDFLPGMVMPTDPELQTSECVLLRSVSVDKFPQVPGPETTVKVYRCNKRQIALYQFINLNTYAVAVKNGQQPIEGCVDEDSLGYCTRLVQEDEEFSVDFKAYNIKTQKFTKYRTDVLELPQPKGLNIPQTPDDFLIGVPTEGKP